MTIQEQDKKVFITLVAVTALGIIFLAVSGIDLFRLFVIAIVALLLGTVGYWHRRKHRFLVSSMKNYVKNTDASKELELAIVKTAYGNYRLGLVSFQAELQNNPNNEELKSIVALFKQQIKK